MARGKKICSGTQTAHERKYLLTTVQMPSSICARVPQKTRMIASAKSATVNFNDASALAPRSSHDSSRTRTDAEALGRGGWPKAGGRLPVTDVLLIAASVEANGTDELL